MQCVDLFSVVALLPQLHACVVKRPSIPNIDLCPNYFNHHQRLILPNCILWPTFVLKHIKKKLFILKLNPESVESQYTNNPCVLIFHQSAAD